MKFINVLRSLLYCVMFSFLLFGCSSNPEKNVAEATGIEGATDVGKKSAHKKSEEAVSVNKTTVISPVLPAGPVTPNPYLLVKPKVSSQVETNFHNAVATMQQKNWAQAEALLQPLAVANPTLSGVQLNLGIVYRAQNDMLKAAEAFNRAITANAKNIDAYNQLALLKREAGDFSAAELLYQKALAVWPFHPESHKNIAILYELYMGKSELALSHYQAYQQLLSAPDKQVDSWVADLQRRVGGGNEAAKTNSTEEVK